MPQVRKVELVPGGSDKPVTAANRQEYVDLVTKWHLDTSIAEPFGHFRSGFYSVASGYALRLFSHEELELLVCGLPHLNFQALQEAAQVCTCVLYYFRCTLRHLSTRCDRDNITVPVEVFVRASRTRWLYGCMHHDMSHHGLSHMYCAGPPPGHNDVTCAAVRGRLQCAASHDCSILASDPRAEPRGTQAVSVLRYRL